MEHAHQPSKTNVPLQTLNLEPEKKPQSESDVQKKVTVLYKKFMDLPEWKQMAITGVVLLLIIATAGGAFALMGKDKKAATSQAPVATATPMPTSTPTPEPEEEVEASPTPKPSPSSTPKPTASPTPKPATSPTPTSTAAPGNKTYVLNWSQETINTYIHAPNESYAVAAILKYDGATVKDQKNVNYTWTIADGSIADVSGFAACTDGIQEPCPYDHGRIKAKKEGSTTVTAKATWKDTGAFIDDVTFQLKVQGNSPSLNPTPTPSTGPSGPPQITISFPQNGQTVTPTSSGTICIAEQPGPNAQGIMSKYSLNGAGWTSYATQTICINPVTGSNTIQIQYKNSGGYEAAVQTVTFTYGS